MEAQDEIIVAVRKAVRDELKAARTANLDALLDINDVADYLRVSKRTVTNLITEGALIPIYVGSQRRFTERAVREYLSSRAGAGRVAA